MISFEKVNIQRRILHGSSTVHVAEARFMHDGDAYGCLINASRAGARSGGCSLCCCGVGLGTRLFYGLLGGTQWSSR